MGCDIHAYVERLNDAGKWEFVEDADPFDCRSYGIFGFLADVRNYSCSPVIAEPRGLPDGLSAEAQDEYDRWDTDAHTASWLLLSELVAYDYDQPMNDRRITRNGDGGVTGTPEEGTVMTVRDFLGEWYMREIERLAAIGEPERVRVTFWFDN